MIRYKCLDCDKEFKMDSKIMYCPYCASVHIEDMQHIQAKNTAKAKIIDLLQLQEKMNQKYSEYAELYAQSESLLQVLRCYKKRGIITNEEIPVLNKPKLADALKEYRSKKKK